MFGSLLSITKFAWTRCAANKFAEAATKPMTAFAPDASTFLATWRQAQTEAFKLFAVRFECAR